MTSPSQLNAKPNVGLDEFEVLCSSESEEDEFQDAASEADAFTNANSKVSFKIGDSSSDCGSSVSLSKSVILARGKLGKHSELYESKSVSETQSQWRKYHFHYDSESSSTDSQKLLAKRKPREPVIISSSRIRLAGTPEVSFKTSRMHTPSNPGLRNVDVDDEELPSESCCNNLYKWRIIIACAITQLLSALLVSLQAPFYPAEAEKKEASATQYGFVFGVFELVVFFAAPTIGSKIHDWNPKLVFNLGIFTTAISAITFGFLDKIGNGKYFIAACVAVRAVEALGDASLMASSFLIVASAFPDCVATTFAGLETLYSFGLISGPFVGSVLFQVGGYSLPFFVVGGALLMAGLINFLLLPSSFEIATHRVPEPLVMSGFKSFRFLKDPAIAMSALWIATGAMSMAYLQATLEPYLRRFEISQLTTGAIFIINGGFYAITAPLWGYLCDKIISLKLVTFCGGAVFVCGFSLIGPVPLFPFEPQLWILSLGLALQGLGLGAVFVSSFLSVFRNAVKLGFPNNSGTYGTVGSLWTSMFSFGSFVGPILSGNLYDAVGFSWGTMVVIIFSLLMMLVLLIFVCISDSEMASFYGEDETAPILNSTTYSSSFYSNDPQPSTSAGARPKENHFYGSI